jgi:hypothetical protein
MQSVRKNITVPVSVEQSIAKYQKQQGIVSWTAALLELARIGLDVKSSK